jgi:hypothetical protein
VVFAYTRRGVEEGDETLDRIRYLVTENCEVRGELQRSDREDVKPNWVGGESGHGVTVGVPPVFRVGVVGIFVNAMVVGENVDVEGFGDEEEAGRVFETEGRLRERNAISFKEKKGRRDRIRRTRCFVEFADVSIGFKRRLM